MLTDEQLKALTQDQALELKGKLEAILVPKAVVEPVAQIAEPTPVLPKEEPQPQQVVEPVVQKENPQPQIDVNKVLDEKMAEYNKMLESKLTSFSTEFQSVVKKQNEVIEKLSAENAELRRTNPTGVPTPKPIVNTQQTEVQELKTSKIASGIYSGYRN